MAVSSYLPPTISLYYLGYDGNILGYDQNGQPIHSGGSYDDSYNGYFSYPGRNTSFKDHPSTSWIDTGLPIKIRYCVWNPL